MEEQTYGERLFLRFERGGFQSVIGSQLTELAAYLEEHAAATGLAVPLFILEAVQAVQTLVREHDEYGGIRNGFLRKLDELVRSALPELRKLSDDPIQAARTARTFKNDVLMMVARYDVRETYDS
jgi:hypothetical protein